MRSIQEPIVVAEENNLFFYDSIVNAELGTEIVDAESGDFVFFDATGKRLTPRVEGDHLWLMDAGRHDEGAERADLEARLHGWFTHFGPQPTEDASLQELLSSCEPYFFKPPRSLLQVLKDFIERRIPR